MSDEDMAMDSVDSDEDIYSAHSNPIRRSKRRSDSNNSGHLTRNSLNVRRSTRHRMQTYDNLNTSWILGTQTLKGYPMFQQHDSSSEKDLADETAERTRDLRDRMPLRSRENHPPINKNTRHIRNREELNNRDRNDREREVNRDKQESKERELRDKTTTTTGDKKVVDKDVKSIQKKSNDVISPKNDDNQQQQRGNNGNELESRKSQYCLRENRVRLNVEKLKLSNNTNDGDTSQESDKNEDDGDGDDGDGNSDNDDDDDGGDGYEDMYTRVKRTRRKSQRQMERNGKKLPEESDISESSDSPSPRKYSLRQKKPTVDRFQANVQPVRRSIRALRSVLTNSMRRRRHRSKSSSSSDSNDSEPQKYDKKKSKKVRQNVLPQGGPPDKIADINPITVDCNIRFNDVGGLESHIHCLKEMVVFPMTYPDVFERFHITPPKGVLFHGPPGTGKTLIARALANECSQQNGKKVSFFMRKGADCLSKWVGESERQLRLLFEQAKQMKPSIIFFDEIDGLTPVRSTKQDQIHASIVSTLLALMDGLSDRGEVIVIGATNRIDAIDPALRRPGRFDRELFFPLPAMKERLEILKIHIKKWNEPPNDELLEFLAEKTNGYCGSDLRALCTEAVIQGLKRTYPQIYLTSNRLLLDPQRVEVKKRDFIQARSILIPARHRISPSISRKLQPFLIPILGLALENLLKSVKTIFPQGTNPALAKIKVAKGLNRPRMLVTGDDMSQGQGSRLTQALLYQMEHVPVHTLDVSTLFAESARSPEETCVQVFNEATRSIPSIIYIRSIDQWWPLVPETVKAVFMCRIAALDPSLPILILATSDVAYQELPIKVKNLFSQLRGEVYIMENPTINQRKDFFKPIFTIQSIQPPLIQNDKLETLEELPLALDPIPKKLTEDEKKLLYDKEEVSLRELRIFLREICAKLARNRQFFMFTKPVDIEEVPDYNSIIKQPMDLETMMTKIDMHCYLCARDFLDDIDLICQNALEYNPDRDPADKLIRHRACSLRDHAYALIKAELDSDFEDKCREISKNRKIILEVKNESNETVEDDKNDKKDGSTTPGGSMIINGRKINSSRKRKVPAWARGFVKKSKKKKISFDDNVGGKSSSSVATSTSSSTSTTAVSTTQSVSRSTSASISPPLLTNSRAIDLDKFQEFEQNNVVNGYGSGCDNSDTENESVHEKSEVLIESTTGDKLLPNDLITQESSSTVDNNPKGLENGESNSSITNDSSDDLTFTVDYDITRTKRGEIDNVIVNKNDLELLWNYCVDVTKTLTVEVLTDIYVQLSRCVGKYERTYDRTTLPMDLLNEIRRFKDDENVIEEPKLNSATTNISSLSSSSSAT